MNIHNLAFFLSVHSNAKCDSCEYVVSNEHYNQQMKWQTKYMKSTEWQIIFVGKL